MYKECCYKTIQANNFKDLKNFSAYNVNLSNSHLFHTVIEMFCINLTLTNDLTYFFLQYQWTPLHRAARKGHSEVVKVLLKCGANPNMTNSVSVWF